MGHLWAAVGRGLCKIGLHNRDVVKVTNNPHIRHHYPMHMRCRRCGATHITFV